MKSISKQEKGQGLVEYALILVLVAIVVIVVLALLGPTIQNVFFEILVALDLSPWSQCSTCHTSTSASATVSHFCTFNAGVAYQTVTDSEGWHTTGPSTLPVPGGSTVTGSGTC